MPISHAIDDKNAIALLRGVYPIIDISPETSLEPMLDWALRLHDAGIRLVQVRAKRFSEIALTGILDDVVGTLKGSGLAVVVNDYIELVGIIGADGVH